MDEFNRRISGIRRAMEEMKTEMYAIFNPVTAALDEYIKSLYIRMLCTVVQYENDPSEMQLLYLRRLHKGIQIDNSIEDFMRMALDISEVDVQEFIDIMRGDHARYYFALEGILLVSMGKGEQANYEYLGELIELISISKRELEYLSTVAKSILEQDSEYYDKAKLIAPETVKEVGMVPYIENYYAGALIDTEAEKYFSSPDRENANNIEYSSTYNNKRITFYNLEIEISKDWKFEGCATVTFERCKLSSNGDGKLIFVNIANLKISNCEFIDFSNHVMSLDCVNGVDISENSFEHCGWTCDGSGKGAVLEMLDVSKTERFNFCKNSLHNCYIKAKKYFDMYGIMYGVTGILMDGCGTSNGNTKTEYVIKNNEFVGCQCINNENYTPAIISGIHDGMGNLSHSDNKCTGEVTRLFE